MYDSFKLSLLFPMQIYPPPPKPEKKEEEPDEIDTLSGKKKCSFFRGKINSKRFYVSFSRRDLQEVHGIFRLRRVLPQVILRRTNGVTFAKLV